MRQGRIRLKLSNPTEVRRTLSRVANMVINGEIDTKTANAVILACNAILGAIRIDEQGQKINEIEKLLDDNSFA